MLQESTNVGMVELFGSGRLLEAVEERLILPEEVEKITEDEGFSSPG